MPEKYGWYSELVIRLLASLLLWGAAVAVAQDASGLPPDVQATVDRIRTEMRIPGPGSTLAAAPLHKAVPLITPEDEDADAEDSAILLRTMRAVTVDDLSGSAAVRDAAELDARDMLDAAQRMAERGDKEAERIADLVAHRDAPAEAAVSAREEATRRRDALDAVSDRAAMLSELIEMARADESGPSGARQTSFGTLRYDGSGRLIRPAEVATLSAAFQRKFAKPMPISAWGETATHEVLGFDHRGRVDVAVGPDSPEGRWIRAWLERSHIPYYGFRMALLGRSTGPHIHIGPGSMRIRTLSRRVVPQPAG